MLHALAEEFKSRKSDIMIDLVLKGKKCIIIKNYRNK